MNEQQMLVAWFNNHQEEIQAPYQPLSALVDKIKSSWNLTSTPSATESSVLQETKKMLGTSMPKISVTLLPSYSY